RGRSTAKMAGSNRQQRQAPRIRKCKMAALDTQLRCNKCGARVTGTAAVGACWSCRADLAQVGATSELLEWGTERQVGRTRYVWLRFVLCRGGLLAVAQSLSLYFFQKDTHPVTYLWTVVSWLVIFYGLGSWHWRAAERQYAAFQE